MTLRFPNEKAMALGGVATGSMKARDAAMVQGSITYRGWIRIAWACKTQHSYIRWEAVCVTWTQYANVLSSAHHWAQNGQEQGGGGCVAGALGERRHQHAEKDRDGEGRDFL